MPALLRSSRAIERAWLGAIDQAYATTAVIALLLPAAPVDLIRETSQKGGSDGTFGLADVFRRGADHRGDHAGDRCDLGLSYHGAVPGNLQGALLGHSLATYGWIWLIIGIILIAAGILVLGPSDQPSAEISRWVGIIAAALAAISAMFVMPYYPVWSLLYIILAVMVVYGLSAHYSEKTA